ncbi:hypothetical protein OKZ62_001771 [Vibrio navarrensis]|nr:hypothetical protein [Vibrio navarrensis]
MDYRYKFQPHVIFLCALVWPAAMFKLESLHGNVNWLFGLFVEMFFVVVLLWSIRNVERRKNIQKESESKKGNGKDDVIPSEKV